MVENKDLLLTDEGEVYNGSANNSASRSPSKGDNAEGNSPKDKNSLSQTADGAQGGWQNQGKISTTFSLCFAKAEKSWEVGNFKRLADAIVC